MDVKLIIRQAIQWQQKGNLKQAIELYQQVLSNHSQHETAMVNLGVALFHGKQYQEAFAQLHRATQIHPESAHANFNLGYAFLQVKKIREAVSHFEKTVQLNPNFFQAQLYLANAYESLSLLEKAFERYHIAYRLQSNHLELLNNWAKLCIGLKKFAQADKILEKALMLYPQRAELYGNQATVQKELGKMQQAEASFKTAITLNPQDWRFYNALGTLYHTCNRYQEALIYLKKALELDSTNAKVHSNIVYLQNYFPEYSNIYHLKAHQEWQKRHASLLLKLQKSYCYSSGLPLKIGLLSGDFHGHPVAVFLLAWLKYVNRAKMEFHAYTEIRHRDATTEKIKKECTNWFETNTLSDREVADKIHSDGIHILMDLAGHTRGNRLAVMAYQAAPIQISYLGYINTTGLPQIDYRLADRYVNPPESQAFYTEKLLYLPNSYTCYSPPDIPDLEVQHTPALKNRYLTFGSFNNPSKYNPEVFQLWAELLRCFPDSKLLLKARHFGTKEGIETVSEMLKMQNINLNQVLFEGASAFDAYFRTYNKIDIALDPFPHHGGTTTHDALYMGVPVVTLAGHSYVNRMGVSILTNLGYPQWIAPSKAEYLEIIKKLTEDWNRLNRTRLSLRKKMLNSPLCEAMQFAQNFEEKIVSIFRDMKGDF